MAAEGIIKVNPEQLMSTAGEFGGQANSLQTLTGNMMNLVTSLTNAWQGEASTAYIGKFQGLQDDMDKMFKMIQGMVMITDGTDKWRRFISHTSKGEFSAKFH